VVHDDFSINSSASSNFPLFIDSVVKVMVDGIFARCGDVRVAGQVRIRIEKAEAAQSLRLQSRPSRSRKKGPPPRLGENGIIELAKASGLFEFVRHRLFPLQYYP